MEGRLKALETGPYGRCVFHCDNDVVDHQTVAMRFANGVNATFTMSGFTMEIRRTITLFGTGGELTGDMEGAQIQIKDFSSRNREVINLAPSIGGHSGGDVNLLTDFVRNVREQKNSARTSIKDSFESHYMAFAAEHSRLNGAKTITLRDFKTAL
jgi:predicted dehydrogenase